MSLPSPFDMSSEPGSLQREGTHANEIAMRQMNYPEAFYRRWVLTTAVSFAIVAMSTWEALLRTAHTQLATSGPGGMLIANIAAASLISLTTLPLAHLTRTTPSSAGQAAWLSRLAPRTHAQKASYHVGFLAVLAWQALAASSTFAAATEIETLAACNANAPDRFITWHAAIFGTCIAVVAVLANTRFYRVLPRLSAGWAGMHIGAAISVGWALSGGIKPGGVKAFPRIEAGPWTSPWGAALLGVGPAMAAYLGADAAAHMAEETRDSSVTSPRAIYISVLGNALLGLGMAVMLSLQPLPRTPPAPAASYVALFSAVSGRTATIFLSVMMIGLSIGSAVARATVASRVLWAFARDGGLAWLHGAQTVDRVAGSRIPIAALAITCVLTSGLCIANTTSTVPYAATAQFGALALLLSYLAPAGMAAVRAPADRSRWALTSSVKGVVYGAVAVGLAVAVVVVCFPARPVGRWGGWVAELNWAPVVLVGGLVLGEGCWWASARWAWFSPADRVVREPLGDEDRLAVDGVARGVVEDTGRWDELECRPHSRHGPTDAVR
ncbi:hypothetical protein EJ06DRAFT_428661 [Trichodelitschia bisporula]|uniref:Amino acid transporter n=1 Tax=Trichodelitschia bisporula TaxID=703511 RepID=A0A6G1HWT0_9PEZI|nr:hypothetical protein EJ06DRAFT_428661 [Trichodelitschia bisporula]